MREKVEIQKKKRFFHKRKTNIINQPICEELIALPSWFASPFPKISINVFIAQDVKRRPPIFFVKDKLTALSHLQAGLMYFFELGTEPHQEWYSEQLPPSRT